MGRKKKRFSKAKPSVLSLVPLAFLGMRAYEGYKAGGVGGAIDWPIVSVTGMTVKGGPIHTQELATFWTIVAGVWVAKKLVKATGVNRAVKGLPFHL